MAFEEQGGGGIAKSPGGFEFGVQGWIWPSPVPRSITFFLDGSALVADQFGRPIRGAVIDGRPVHFATTPPSGDQPGDARSMEPYPKRSLDLNGRKVPLATHEEVVAALEAERIEWLALTRAGVPQLSYEKLRTLPRLPNVSEEELRRIPDPARRRDVIRAVREAEEARLKELTGGEDS